MKFVDEVEIVIGSGSGGPGVRELSQGNSCPKRRSRQGGDGGRGAM